MFLNAKQFEIKSVLISWGYLFFLSIKRTTCIATLVSKTQLHQMADTEWTVDEGRTPQALLGQEIAYMQVSHDTGCDDPIVDMLTWEPRYRRQRSMMKDAWSLDRADARERYSLDDLNGSMTIQGLNSPNKVETYTRFLFLF